MAETQRIAGTLNPVWMIDRLRTTRGGNSEKVDSNTPPVVHVEPQQQTIAPSATATLVISATDDGLPERRGKPIGMSVQMGQVPGAGRGDVPAFEDEDRRWEIGGDGYV